MQKKSYKAVNEFFRLFLSYIVPATGGDAESVLCYPQTGRKLREKPNHLITKTKFDKHRKAEVRVVTSANFVYVNTGLYSRTNKFLHNLLLPDKTLADKLTLCLTNT
jgi:hypothetical protein